NGAAPPPGKRPAWAFPRYPWWMPRAKQPASRSSCSERAPGRRRRRISLGENFPGIHDSVRVEGLLDLAHQGHGLSMLCLQEGDLAVTDAVLPSTGAPHGDGAHDHAVVVGAGAAIFLFVLFIDQVDEVEVAIPH